MRSNFFFWCSYIKNTLQNTRLWVGLSDLASEGTWMWVDGKVSNISAEFWVPGQPSNTNREEHCAEVGWRDDYLTNDVNCNSHFYAVCEKIL